VLGIAIGLGAPLKNCCDSQGAVNRESLETTAIMATPNPPPYSLVHYCVMFCKYPAFVCVKIFRMGALFFIYIKCVSSFEFVRGRENFA